MMTKIIGCILLGGLFGFIFGRVLGVFSIVWWISIIMFAIGISMVIYEGE